MQFEVPTRDAPASMSVRAMITAGLKSMVNSLVIKLKYYWSL
jgi:hypothetical protein